VELYEREQRTGQWLANDTSIGVGFAPLSKLESVVLHVEQHLNATATRRRFPMLGRDIKVLGARNGQRIKLTIAAAFIDRCLLDLRAYAAAKTAVAEDVRAIASDLAALPVEAEVNAADDLAAGSVYITVSGTSAEGGDDGQAGRGNRVNGLITPYRPMTMESVAGKNPMTHVGKTYNVTASLIADALVQELPEILEAHCWLLSRIGQPVNDPAMVNLKLRLIKGMSLAKIKPAAREIVQAEMARLSEISAGLVTTEIVPNRWPLGPRGAGIGPFGERRQALVEAIADEASRTAAYTRRPKFSHVVLQAVASVPRHQFVAEHLVDSAYQDEPLAIGCGQVISEPYLVALMTDLIDPASEDVVLEVGTGSGYQAAVLSLLTRRVYTIEVVPELAATAGLRLRRLGYSNIVARTGDGRAGWPERALFDAIIVTAVAASPPPALIAQLKPGGRLVIPIGEINQVQWLFRLTKDADGTVREEKVLPVSFVPLLN
jgi:protein-L-isoaspartate(D-aspartate) O-methyltransferase